MQGTTPAASRESRKRRANAPHANGVLDDAMQTSPDDLSVIDIHLL
jgi:hypothetical protein